MPNSRPGNYADKWAGKGLALDDPWEDESDVVSGPAAAKQHRRILHSVPPPPEQTAYEQGYAGLGPDDSWSDTELASYHAGKSEFEGPEPVSSPARAGDGKAPAPQGAPSRGLFTRAAGAVKSAGGGTPASFFLGAVIAANVMAYLNYGPAGVKSWWSAKFWNAPSLSAAAAAPAKSTAPAASTSTPHLTGPTGSRLV